MIGEGAVKRLLAILLALLVPGCPALGESAQSTALCFSSFAGGGYEYSVEVDDPSVVRCETRYEYEQSDEPIDGASYDFIASFTGLKPGTTRVAVYGRSPILENEDSVYTVTVDDALNVTLTPVRMIATFYISRMIEGGFASFKVTREEGGYRVSVDEGPERPFSADAADELMRAIDAYDVAAWDGFQESDYTVEDGENFRLSIGFTDGTGVSARGDNAFPDNYSDAMAEMWRILTWNAEDESEESEEEEASGEGNRLITIMNGVLKTQAGYIFQPFSYASSEGGEPAPVEELILDEDTELVHPDQLDGYEPGDSAVEWIDRLMSREEDSIQANGVYDVDVTNGHIDRVYGLYWWD